ncbi:MAG: DNA-binding response regulator [Hydrogenophilales bacterium 28-61-23]|nr:MAG: DNA-binding response regulator [Hydrogenophilales bacterium 28-61-23]
MSAPNKVPLKVILADDEALARARLADLLLDLAGDFEVEVVAQAGNGEIALERAADTPADVILLDIQMPGMNGLEAARHIARLPRPPAIVFVTAFDEHAVQAFELRAIDYLLKPVRLARLREALSRIKPLALADAEALAPRRTHFSLLERGRIWRVPVADVLYLRAELRYVTARTREREYLLDESLVKLEEEFGDEFLRIHRNCLIARRHLAGFQRHADEGEGHWLAVLKESPERLPVSRRQMHVVREFVKSA